MSEHLAWKGGRHKPRSEGFVSGVRVEGTAVPQPGRPQATRGPSVLEERATVVTVRRLDEAPDDRILPSGRFKLRR
ncbi:MAG: hypothetical protein H6739_08560 [Alphaproteobacteria bacterium]|nr:hypothetical protein [Alphaproteobacteria bacterium]